MQKLLAFHNIKMVTFPVENGVPRHFAFTSKMASNNIFIEFRIKPEEDLEDEDDDDEPEFGARLSVLIKHDKKYYEFLMFHNTVQVEIPILMGQIIVFLTNICENSKPSKLIEILLETCPDPLIPHEIKKKSFREAALQLISVKISTIHQLISEGKSDQN